MKIVYDGARAYLKQCVKRTRNYINSVLSYTDQNAVMKNRNPKNRYRLPEVVSCLNNKQQSFPTGLLPKVCDALDLKGVDYTLEALVEPPKPADRTIPDWAWPHQKELVTSALNNIRSIGQSPTGSGKTKSICFFTQFFPDQQILIMAPRNGIVKNTKRELEGLLGEDIGQYGGGVKSPKRVTVGTVKSLYENLNQIQDWLASIEVLIVDECHHINSGMYLTVSDAMPNRSYSWGLSATAYRSKGDDNWMIGVLGPIGCRIPEKRLAKEGVIQEPKFCALELHHPEYRGERYRRVEVDPHGQYHTYYETWNGKPEKEEIYEKGIVANEERNALFIDLLDYYLNHPARQGVAVVLFQLKDQGHALYQLAKDKDLPIEYADGDTAYRDRVALVEGLRAGTVPAAVASRILDEGEDIPNLEFCCIAGGGANNRIVTQQVGRLVRNKANALAIDIHDKEKWYLENNSRQRQDHIQSLYPGSLEYAEDLDDAKRWIDRHLKS